VQVATRWIVAQLRHRRFFSLGELNAAIGDLVARLNNRVTWHLGTSRRALFEDIERPALKALPVEPYTYAEWKQCKVSFDYHVEVERHCSSRLIPKRCRLFGSDHAQIKENREALSVRPNRKTLL